MAAAIAKISAPMVNTLDTIKIMVAAQEIVGENCSRKITDKPLRWTSPNLAHIDCTAISIGVATSISHSWLKPKAAPEMEYVAIPEGSLSAPPVISPGVKRLNNLL